jgi:hypothetical protein
VSPTEVVGYESISERLEVLDEEVAGLPKIVGALAQHEKPNGMLI